MTVKTQPTAHAEITAPISADLRRIEQEAQELPEPSPTAGMNLGQRILHVGGRENAAGYIEFGSVAAVRALVGQVLRDLPSRAAAKCLHRADAAHDPALEKPEAGRYVLAWTEGVKVPIRAMWAPQFFLEMAYDDAESGEYCEAKDQYFCPEGWYENNAHEETHWNVDRPVIAWMELPRLDAALQADPPAPAVVSAPIADDAARFKAQHDFLKWNRAQHDPLVKAAREYGVFNKAVDLYRDALAAAPAQAAAWMTPEGDRVVTESTMAGARKDGGAMLSSLRPFTVALGRIAAQPTQAQEDARDADRWRQVLRHVGGQRHAGCQTFGLVTLKPVSGNIMQGSVAEHFTKAIDAARAAQGGAA